VRDRLDVNAKRQAVPGGAVARRDTQSSRAVVIMTRSMQAKSEGRGASMGLGFDVAGWSMERRYTG
jgi:hypothetical protein